ncbi:MAG: hypothetical protein KKD44_19755 [Proteobacteria bacterium]|nr:hypothetical protein [Pseudomonadota bacterium]
MTDEYLHRDDQGIAILDGHRQGEDRRGKDERRFYDLFDEQSRFNHRHELLRREPGERRIGPVYSRSDLFYENLSSFIFGGFLIMMGICMLITGLTFLPVVGLYAGVAVIIIGAGFLARSFKANWPRV